MDECFLVWIEATWHFFYSFRTPWWCTQRSASGGRWDRLGDCCRQRSSGGTRSAWEAQKCHPQDLLQVWENHKWLLPWRGWKDKRVRVLVAEATAVGLGTCVFRPPQRDAPDSGVLVLRPSAGLWNHSVVSDRRLRFPELMPTGVAGAWYRFWIEIPLSAQTQACLWDFSEILFKTF